MKNIVFVLVCFLTNGMIYSQDFIKHEYFFNGGNLRSSIIQQKDDGNFVVTAQKDCYTPGSITIEGCPIARHIFEIDYFGNKIWSSDLDLWHNSVPEKMIENINENWVVVTSQPINWNCGQIGVGLYGLSRLSRYKLSPFGEILDTIVLNNECGYGLIDLIRLDNNDIQIMAIPDSLDIFFNTHFIELDEELNVKVDKILPSSEVIYYSLIRTENQNTFATQTNQLQDSLNLLLIDSGGEITQTLPITDSDKIRSVQMNNLQNSDLLLGVLRKSFSNQDQVFELIRVTQEGEIRWSKIFPDVLSAIILENSDGIIHFITSEYNNVSSSIDVFLTFLDPNGETLTTKYYEVSEKDEVPIDAIFDKEGNLVILGNSNCCNMDTTIGPGRTFVFIDTVGLIVGNVQSIMDRPFSIYPNPANNTIYFESNGAHKKLEYYIYDILGRIVSKGAIMFNRQIDISDLKLGTYILRMQSSEGDIFSEKFTKL
ncbi:MAG: hypothetical protein DRI69_06925 [Bacteroidetes bacterium]|nr:MAG: hypothetical protein DRI69_06925 [Bacteroidota bacterium]